MFETWFPRHWTTLKKLIWLRMTALGNAIKTVTGAIVTFITSKAAPLINLTATLEPIQDLHGYDSPWPSGGGKNKLDPSKRTSVQGGYKQTWYETDGYTLIANQAYTFSATFENPIALYIKHKTTGNDLATGNNSITYTPTEDTVVYFQAYRVQDISAVDTFQLELGSSSTPWTPYENICPISGHTGVTVYVSNENLYDKVAHPYTQYSQYLPSVCWTSPIFFKSGIYTFACVTGYGQNYINVYATEADAIANTNRISQPNFNNSSSYTLTLTDDAWIRVQQNNVAESVEAYAAVSDALMINIGSTALPYVAHTGNTYPITFPDGQTVYSGTVSVNEDGSGEIVVDYARSKLTSFTNAFGPETNGYVAYVSLDAQTRTDVIPEKMLSNMFKYTRLGIGSMPLFSYCGGSGGDGTYSFVLPSTITSKDEADAWISSVGDVYYMAKLSTPITIPLTASQIKTLKGTNVVWVDDSDNISVTYRK